MRNVAIAGVQLRCVDIGVVCPEMNRAATIVERLSNA